MGLLAWTLPAIEAVGAGLLWRKRREFPAFLSFLCFGVLFDSLSAWQYAMFAPIKILPRLVFSFWLLNEAFRVSRSKWEPSEARIATSWAAITAFLVVGLTWIFTSMAPVDNVMVAHQYVYLCLMAAAWSLEARAWMWPALERKRNRAYRHGITSLITVYAIGSGTSRWGFVFLFVPQSWSESQLDALCQVFRWSLLVGVALCVAGTIGGLMLRDYSKRTARISGTAKRSNVVTIRQAA